MGAIREESDVVVLPHLQILREAPPTTSEAM
jgi:hypothetical protein